MNNFAAGARLCEPQQFGQPERSRKNRGFWQIGRCCGSQTRAPVARVALRLCLPAQPAPECVVGSGRTIDSAAPALRWAAEARLATSSAARELPPKRCQDALPTAQVKNLFEIGRFCGHNLRSF